TTVQSPNATTATSRGLTRWKSPPRYTSRTEARHTKTTDARAPRASRRLSASIVVMVVQIYGRARAKGGNGVGQWGHGTRKPFPKRRRPHVSEHQDPAQFRSAGHRRRDPRFVSPIRA